MTHLKGGEVERAVGHGHDELRAGTPGQKLERQIRQLRRRPPPLQERLHYIGRLHASLRQTPAHGPGEHRLLKRQTYGSSPSPTPRRLRRPQWPLSARAISRGVRVGIRAGLRAGIHSPGICTGGSSPGVASDTQRQQLPPLFAQPLYVSLAVWF